MQATTKRMINLRLLLASTTNNNFTRSKYAKKWFRSTHFLFCIKDICLLDIICYVANPENAVQESRGDNKTMS